MWQLRRRRLHLQHNVLRLPRRRRGPRSTDAVLGAGGSGGGSGQQLAVRGARDADLPRGALLLALGMVRLHGLLLRSEQGHTGRVLQWGECVHAPAAVGAAEPIWTAALAAVHQHGQRRHGPVQRCLRVGDRCLRGDQPWLRCKHALVCQLRRRRLHLQHNVLRLRRRHLSAETLAAATVALATAVAAAPQPVAAPQPAAATVALAATFAAAAQPVAAPQPAAASAAQPAAPHAAPVANVAVAIGAPPALAAAARAAAAALPAGPTAPVLR